MNTRTLRSMPIFEHKLEINIGFKLKILQDLNCRFTKDPILITIFVAPKGYYAKWF